MTLHHIELAAALSVIVCLLFSCTYVISVLTARFYQQYSYDLTMLYNVQRQNSHTVDFAGYRHK